MSKVHEIGASLATHIEATISGSVAVFEPTEQFDAGRTITAAVYWEGGSEGTPDGDLVLGGEVDQYTDTFTINLARQDGNTSQLIEDQQTLSHSINYDWTGPSGVSSKRVTARSVSRERMDESQMSDVRLVDLTVQVSYIE